MRLMLLLFLTLLIITANGFAYEKTDNLKLDAKGIKALDIDCGAGFLIVEGEEGLSSIEVKAEIVLEGANDREVEKILKHKMKLYLKKRGNTAILKSHIDNDSFSFFGGHRGMYIDLTVKVPKGIDLEIEDGSGSIDVVNINGQVKIDDGSGGIEVEKIDGDVDIEDGSGELSVSGVNGRTDIHDGSGSIRVRDITGDLKIRDGSGEIDVTEVKGEVNIKDGSGEMTIEKIQGDVVIRDGSGSIYVNDVENDVVINEAGSGSVKIRGVKGNVERND